MAASARTAPATRVAVSGLRPPGPSPTRSNRMPLSVCPATIATVKSATPTTPADSPWVVTNQAPESPPSTIHQASLR